MDFPPLWVFGCSTSHPLHFALLSHGFFYETKKFACFLFAFLYRCYFSFCTLRQADQVAGSSSSTIFHFKNYETASARLITKLSLLRRGLARRHLPSSLKPALMLLFHPKTSANKRWTSFYFCLFNSLIFFKSLFAVVFCLPSRGKYFAREIFLRSKLFLRRLLNFRLTL